MKVIMKSPTTASNASYQRENAENIAPYHSHNGVSPYEHYISNHVSTDSQYEENKYSRREGTYASHGHYHDDNNQLYESQQHVSTSSTRVNGSLPLLDEKAVN